MKVAVDLTPLLPGGANGGAKAFALVLIRQLAGDNPGTRFLLLTQAASHDELASLDRDNVTRSVVVGAGASRMRAAAFGAMSQVISPLPASLRRAAARAGYGLHRFMKRSAARGFLREAGVDLLFCPFTAPTLREEGVPTICVVYDLQYRTFPEFFTPEDALQRARAFEEAAREATVIAAISDHTRSAILEAVPAAAGRVVTVPIRMPVLPRPNPEVAEKLFARMALRPSRYFLYPANFWKHKNHERLFTAFRTAHELGLGNSLALVCTGAPGADQEERIAMAKRIDREGRIVFAGYVDREEFSALLANCRGLVFPSLFEGFGMPIVEAMAAGVPVACSRAGALPEVAGGAALLFDPLAPKDIAAAMVALDSDAALRERLITAGRIRAAEFADPARMAAGYRALFERAVAPAA